MKIEPLSPSEEKYFLWAKYHPYTENINHNKYLDSFKSKLLSESGSISHSGLNSIFRFITPKIPTPSNETVKITVKILNGVVTKRLEKHSNRFAKIPGGSFCLTEKSL